MPGHAVQVQAELPSSLPGKDTDFMYVNTASLSNGTSFVESLFEEFGTWDHLRMVLGSHYQVLSWAPSWPWGLSGGQEGG